MGTLMINNKPVFVRNSDDFADVLNENLGYEAEEFYREDIEQAKESTCQCHGECDATYRIQEHYERLLRDIQDELTSWQVKKLTKDEITKKRDALWKMIEGEL